MKSIVSWLDVTRIFCEVDDFCSSWRACGGRYRQWLEMWQQIKDAFVGGDDDRHRVAVATEPLKSSTSYRYCLSGWLTIESTNWLICGLGSKKLPAAFKIDGQR